MLPDEWRLSFEIAWDDAWYRWQASLTIASYVFGTGFFLAKLIPAGMDDGRLIFHYNPYFGIDQVHHWAWAVAFSIIFLLLVIIDLVSAARLYRHDRIASRVLLCTASLFVVLFLIAAYGMTIVNV